MERKPSSTITPPTRDSMVLCRNAQGAEFRATLIRLTRYAAVLEVYNPFSILQLSEVVTDFRILMGERLVYSGRAVVTNLVNTGQMLVCEVSLDEAWLEVDIFSPVNQRDKLHAEFAEFLREWKKVLSIRADFKVVVADMQAFLVDLRRWLEQLELGIRSEPAGDVARIQGEVIHELEGEILPVVNQGFFARFDEVAAMVDEDRRPIHRAFARRQLHPLLLCAPFVYRTYQKPLGYAGDYEMVNMILRDPYEGGSLFAKMVNVWFLKQAPAQAHRNRVTYLAERLEDETLRVAREGNVIQIFNLGCGPAGEIQHFLKKDDLCDRADFTLLDFNDETLEHTGRLLEEIRVAHQRKTTIKMVKKSVHQILKEAARSSGDTARRRYDYVYCAGLFDYLSDRICKRLMDFFYDLVVPGGLLVATNVDASNPTRHGMEYILDWHLVYRNSVQLAALKPDAADPGEFSVKSDATGVNIYIEVRKPNIA